MSQDKTVIPGLGDGGSFNEKRRDSHHNNMYSRSSTYVNVDYDKQGTIVPGMERRAPGVNESTINNNRRADPVVGFLYSISRQGIGEFWPIYVGRNTIGRSEKCDICLNEHTVSELHAVLNVKQMKTTHKVLASIKDEGSKNGIFVNEEELDYSAHECFNNDILTIGLNYRLLLILIDAEALGLSVSKDFISIDTAENDNYDESFNQQVLHGGHNFNPYDHNKRRQNGGTVPLDGGNMTEPGGTQFM